MHATDSHDYAKEPSIDLQLVHVLWIPRTVDFLVLHSHLFDSH